MQAIDVGSFCEVAMPIFIVSSANSSYSRNAPLKVRNRPLFEMFTHLTPHATALAPNNNMVNATQGNSRNACDNQTNNAVEVARKRDNLLKWAEILRHTGMG